ncbi:anti-sigma factor [Saccharomonospora sp. NPDC006951]
MNHDFPTLTGAYAVNALTGRERAEFEHHLAHCEECAQEVEELRATAARLGAAMSAEPPGQLRERVLYDVAHTRQEPPSEEPRRGPGRPSSRWRGWATKAAVAAAVAGIALAGVFGGMALNQHNELRQAEQRIEQAGARGADMAAVLHADDVRVLHSAGEGTAATVVVSAKLGKAVFLGERLPSVPEDRVYQLWAMGPSGAHSLGVLAEATTGAVQPVVGNLPEDTTALGLTAEPAGGSPQPTSDPIMRMAL